MRKKAELAADLVEAAKTETLLGLYFEFNHLKQIYRQGWLKRGVPVEQCETVAEHILGVALLGWLLADEYFPELARDKILRLALIHDLGEVYAGDLTPADQVPPAEKQRRERAALLQMLAELKRGPEYLALWEEYEAGESREARLVRQLDRLEMACQALVYERMGTAELGEFFASAARDISQPEIQHLLEVVRRIARDG